MGPSTIANSEISVHDRSSALVNHNSSSAESDDHLSDKVVTNSQTLQNPFRKGLHFPIIYTPVIRYPSIKVPSLTPKESSGGLPSFCTYCLVVCHPDSLATVDHEGLSMYCPTCVSLSSQPDLVQQLSQDLSSHAQSSTCISPFNPNVADSFNTHDSTNTLELGSTSDNLSGELGSYSVFDVSTELGSSSPELSQSAFAAAISSCTSRDSCVTLAPVAGDLYGLHSRS